MLESGEFTTMAELAEHEGIRLSMNAAVKALGISTNTYALVEACKNLRIHVFPFFPTR
tara:strand:+ start:2207 stop:2380 length:174 start_codon:yes stop_codon:yes gene_type:complete